MVSFFAVYALVLLATAVVVGALGVYAWDRRDRTGAKPLLVVLIGQTVWCLCAFAAIAGRGTPWALLWSRAWYVGVVLTVAGLFVFALAYTGYDEYLGPKLYAALSVEPLLLLGVTALEPVPFLYTVVGPAETAMLGYHVDSGVAFWLHAGYSYLLLAAGSALLVRYALSTDALRRKQLYAILGAIVAPWFGNALYLFGGVPVDLTPLAFSLTGILLTWAVLQAGFLDISPAARREVVDSLSSAVFVVDTDGRIVEVNDACRELFDVTPLVGAPVERVLRGMADLEADCDDVGTDETVTVEAERDGRFFDVQVSPLYDDFGGLIGRVFLAHDITEQKERQRELERRNRQLDQFASVVTHDLRNPLSVAGGSLALARRTGDEEHFDRVEDAHDRMGALIDEVLALARDQSSLDEQSLRLSDVANAAWGHVDTADATLSVPEDRTVVGDRDQLLRLFENLFRNSVEHGGRDVTVIVTATDGGFAVADDGPGVPEDERDALFDHGYTTSEHGTGLGLAIVEHVVSSHGWDLAVGESEQGGFRLTVTGVTGEPVERPAEP
ncbi:histidine kinase N-terminal 7TM domain-containing protein [Haloarcula litorea]|uniref:histidine kinase N-terminal 7TM domain-containing protein n=1 Tax=Haloarcula litorea TaxID=3032579 RepID=UPI0023E86078|nr:histidine kinase N-terminal 7TM domain-containing protein [Halomicroarcula sp. GDY20]